jgi:rhodanese-related sulfurtransferase
MSDLIQLTPHQLKDALSSAKPPVVIDVRMPNETAVEGHIEGAVLIPLPELPQRLGEVPAGRDVICVCKMGMRSFNAAAFLKQRGIDAANMIGGMNAWVGAGFPVKR